MNKSILIALSAIGGAVAGGTVTYITVNRALRTRYEDWANEQIESVKARYAALNNDKKMSFIELAQNPSPEILAAVEAGKRIIEQSGYSPSDEDPVHESAVTLSIFERGVDIEDVADAIEEAEEDDIPEGYEPSDERPYLITEEAFFENEAGYELDTLMYYSLDDVLVDEKNERIERVEETIGVANLSRFPRAKGADKVSLYVRNDDHLSFYEVILVDEAYSKVMFGIDPDDTDPPKKLKKMKKDVEV